MNYKEKYKDYIGKKFKYKQVKEKDYCEYLINKIVTVVYIEPSGSAPYPFGVKEEGSTNIVHVLLEELEFIVEKKNHLPKWF